MDAELDLLHGKILQLAELCRQLRLDNNQLRDRLADVRVVTRPLVLGPLAVDAVPGLTPPRGLLLAGDAAGFIDPMTGDGLRFAVRGGELAAQVLSLPMSADLSLADQDRVAAALAAVAALAALAAPARAAG